MIDLRHEIATAAAAGPISRPLHQAMDAALEDGGQVILLLNRRGFSRTFTARPCGQVVKCPHCDLALTYHQQDAARDLPLLRLPDAARRPTARQCQSPASTTAGSAPSGWRARSRHAFPSIAACGWTPTRCRSPAATSRRSRPFRDGEVHILLGTQMIAKGLDFPNVTLVGVVNADTALHLPDFRAAERTFQLVTQVAGRTGRGEKGGRVLVQTFSPEHPAIVAAVRHDYAAFAEQELPHRGNRSTTRRLPA